MGDPKVLSQGTASFQAGRDKQGLLSVAIAQVLGEYKDNGGDRTIHAVGIDTEWVFTRDGDRATVEVVGRRAGPAASGLPSRGRGPAAAACRR